MTLAKARGILTSLKLGLRGSFGLRSWEDSKKVKATTASLRSEAFFTRFARSRSKYKQLIYCFFEANVLKTVFQRV